MDENNTNNSQSTESKEELEALRLQLAECQLKVSQVEDALLRARAENDNLRKRFIREAEDNKRLAISSFAYDLIDSVENLYRAVDSIPQEKALANEVLKQHADGIMLTQKLLMEAFAKHGIRRIYPLNQQFDHACHQAIMQVEDNDVQPNTVVQVISAGYMIQDSLLKAALVGVSKHGNLSSSVEQQENN